MLRPAIWSGRCPSTVPWVAAIRGPSFERGSIYAMRRKIQFYTRFTDLSLEFNH
jgi:hypothetical protein